MNQQQSTEKQFNEFGGPDFYGGSYTLTPNQMQTSQTNLSLSEKIKRRQMFMQMQDNEAMLAQMSIDAKQRNETKFELSSDLDFSTNQTQSATGTTSNNEIGALNFSVDELIMDDDQRFHFNIENKFM